MAPRYIDPDTLSAREDEILDRALEIIEAQGMAFLTIDKLVASVDYSKGTVYNHFSSKEDVFTALCNRNMHDLAVLFRRAAAIDASARHKMTAIGFAYLLTVLLTPQCFTLMMNAKTEIFEKAAPERGEEHERLDNVLFSICGGVVKEAVDNKELVLAEGLSENEVSFAVYAMCFGTISLLLKRDRTCCSSVVGAMLEASVIAHGNLVMDGFSWKKPDRDDSDFVGYLKSTIFSDEIKILHDRGVDLQQGI